ncbi:hypothetical protein T4B_8181 [Trichinella pseudospiralis]|uniref:Uncharacterized protein n=1 Tax=Trichinella pseudospiralis TaxID=6337 RepID=A0A0V1IAN7_TRIPS|nr:hypothetical protein T4B_8181 [Trichinella pseudospiralis]
MHPSSDNITAINNNVFKCSSRLTVYSKLALVIAVLVNRLYTLWLWVSTAAICDSLCVVIRRVSRSFMAICLITLPSWVTHAVLPDGTVGNGPTPCYEVKPSAFGKMMDNLPLNITHWSCLWIFICPNIAYHLPLSVFAISAGFNVTPYMSIVFHYLKCVLSYVLQWIIDDHSVTLI